MPSRRRRQHGFSLVEIMIALTVVGLMFAIVTSQFVESTKLTKRITQTLEHSRNAREVIDTLAIDIRAAQILKIHPSFLDRSTVARDGQTGNYLLLQSVDATGTITRTVGYYLVTSGTDNWTLHRHDSAQGDNAADAAPNISTVGSHRKIKRAIRLPSEGMLFRSARDRGVSIHGEFSSPDTMKAGRTEFIQTTLSTRS